MPLGLELAVRGVFNRARRGLYAGKYIRSGNNISEDGKNKYGVNGRHDKICASAFLRLDRLSFGPSFHRTRRTWLPNAQFVNLYSPALNKTLRLRVTTSALRYAVIEKEGGERGDRTIWLFTLSWRLCNLFTNKHQYLRLRYSSSVDQCTGQLTSTAALTTTFCSIPRRSLIQMLVLD